LFTLDPKGLRLLIHDLFLDARRVVDFSFVSHAHSDHLRNHRNILASPATAAFYQYFHRERKRKANIHTLEYGKPYRIDELTITLYPSGHILGAAMIHVEYQGETLLYTGDFKLHKGRAAEAIQIPQADLLIMESTYGSPEYAFSRERPALPSKIGDWIRKTQRQGFVPVVLAYSLGKAQEAMAILEDLGFRPRVHPQIWDLAQIYKRFGIVFSKSRPFTEGFDPQRDVLIFPPGHFRRQAHMLPFRMKTLFLSGWANGQRRNHWIQWDDALPLSDHADFDELLDFVFMVNPRKVFTCHGFPEFARTLQHAGFNAEYLPL